MPATTPVGVIFAGIGATHPRGLVVDTGAHDYNVSLSQKRADSVKAYLVSKGIGADRIHTRGAGPDEPLVNEKTGAARQKNRRIEFKIQQ